MSGHQRRDAALELDAAISDLAARQHGAVARRQLLALGLPGHRIDYRISRGRLVPLHWGVYRLGPIAGPSQREMAAVLACGPGSAVGGPSAAALFGLLANPGTAARVTVVGRRTVRVRDPGIRYRRTSHLADDEVQTLEGVPVTTPGRTLLDCAGTLSSRDLEIALARARRAGLIRRRVVETLAARHPHHRGRRRLVELIADDTVAAFTRSEAERRLLELIRAAGLPAPEVNVLVEGFEVDFLWRRERLVVEVDGRRYHSDTLAFDADRRRDATLIAAGYSVMRVTWKHITRERLTLVTRLTRALAHRAG